MFKVVDATTGELVTCIEYHSFEELNWRYRDAFLRGELRCPHCRERVILKCSEARLPYFAHKVFNACPYSNETTEALKARLVLYRFLRNIFGGEVEIEHNLEHSDVPRPVDCWMDRAGASLAYWLVERDIPGHDKVDALRAGIKSRGAIPQFIFLARLLRQADEEQNTYVLSPSEIRLLRRSKYDAIYGERGTSPSLNYLDAEALQPAVITLRALKEQRRGGHFISEHRQTTSLSWLTVDELTGEFVHPGEKEQLEEFLDAAARRKAEAAACSQSALALKLARTMASVVDEVLSRPPTEPKPAPVPPAQPSRADVYLDREAPCERCGIITNDWMSYEGKTGLCKCNNCFQPERQKAMQAFNRFLEACQEPPERRQKWSGSNWEPLGIPEGVGQERREEV
jgi:hypothetical protein